MLCIRASIVISFISLVFLANVQIPDLKSHYVRNMTEQSREQARLQRRTAHDHEIATREQAEECGAEFLCPGLERKVLPANYKRVRTCSQI
jgi:hypothetical protein